MATMRVVSNVEELSNRAPARLSQSCWATGRHQASASYERTELNWRFIRERERGLKPATSRSSLLTRGSQLVARFRGPSRDKPARNWHTHGAGATGQEDAEARLKHRLRTEVTAQSGVRQDWDV